MLNFTCPHCGRRAERTDLGEADVEYIDLGNGLPDAIFPRLGPDEERHINQRLCCTGCWARASGPAGERGLELEGKRHPYSLAWHREHLIRIDAAEAGRRGVEFHGRFTKEAARAITPLQP